MTIRQTLLASLLIVLSVQDATAKKPVGFGNVYKNPNQKVEIPGAAASLSTAHRKCENYAWAAIVEAMMRVQDVNITQDDWAVRTSSGMKCFPDLHDYAERAATLVGDYTLDGGRKVRIQTEYIDGVLQPNQIVPSLRAGRPLMVVWNNRPYLLYGVVYDEMIHTSGAGRQYIIREMKLLDAAVPADKPERMVSFIADRDGADSIKGVMTITVTPRTFYSLP